MKVTWRQEAKEAEEKVKSFLNIYFEILINNIKEMWS